MPAVRQSAAPQPQQVDMGEPEGDLLDTMAERIRDALSTGEKVRLEHYHRAGQLLTECKAQLEHGLWLPLLKKIGINDKKAQRLMALSKFDVTSDLRPEWRRINGNDRGAKETETGPPLNIIDDGTSDVVIPGDVARQYTVMTLAIIRKLYQDDSTEYLTGRVAYEAMRRYYAETVQPSAVLLALLDSGGILAAWEKHRGSE